jgi:hypothetical protein
MTACTDIFWHELYRGAGIFLGVVGPLLLSFFGVMLVLFRQQQRHEARMHEARLQEEQARDARYRVVRGGQG